MELGPRETGRVGELQLTRDHDTANSMLIHCTQATRKDVLRIKNFKKTWQRYFQSAYHCTSRNIFSQHTTVLIANTTRSIRLPNRNLRLTSSGQHGLGWGMRRVRNRPSYRVSFKLYADCFISLSFYGGSYRILPTVRTYQHLTSVMLSLSRLSHSQCSPQGVIP